MLTRLGEGKEATAWHDEECRCVYKLFDLRSEGQLGQKIVFDTQDIRDCSISYVDATLFDTLDKLRLLHEAGGCPTEIVGLADAGDYLVAKQPFCRLYKSGAFNRDRDIAAEMMRAVMPRASYKLPLWIFWMRDQPWCLGDLHEGNIRRTWNDVPTVIDALTGPVPSTLLKQVHSLQKAAGRAKIWRETGVLPGDDPFEGVSDDEL